MVVMGAANAGSGDAVNFQTIPGSLPADLGTIAECPLAEHSEKALQAVLRARRAYFKQSGLAGKLAGLDALPASPTSTTNQPFKDAGLAADLGAAGLTSIGGTQDELSGQVSQPIDPAQSFSGFYVSRTDGGVDSQAGRCGVEIHLNGTGGRTLQGKLNFGGQAICGIAGFSAFSIDNPANERQVVTICQDPDAPGIVFLERGQQDNTTIFIDTKCARHRHEHHGVACGPTRAAIGQEASSSHLQNCGTHIVYRPPRWWIHSDLPWVALPSLARLKMSDFFEIKFPIKSLTSIRS